MTAAAAKVTLANDARDKELGVLRDIPVDDLRVAEWNARKTFDPQAFAELKESIRAHGVQAPLLVRILPMSAWKSLDDETVLRKSSAKLYEIVAGHRRFKAAQELTYMDVPCIVREMTDDEAREKGLVDNLQREDVPALEEADAYAELQQRLGTPAAIAARVGKDTGYVAKRLQLVELREMPRKALAERLMTIDHALLLARLGDQEQLTNLKWLLNPNAGVKEKLEDLIAYRLKDRADENRLGYREWEPQSPLALKNHIEQHVGRKLKRAPWDLKDAGLVAAAGACVGCPSNTADNTALFGDLSIDEATCENGRCFEEKRVAFVQIQLLGLPKVENEVGLPVPPLRLSWKQSSAEPKFSKGTRDVKTVLREGQWVKAKKGSCAHVRSGVAVDWSDEAHYGFTPAERGHKPGEVLQVCIEPKCKAHPKRWEKAERGEVGAPRNENSAEARAAREKQEVLAGVENAIRADLVKKALAGVTKLHGEILRRIVLQAWPSWRGEVTNALFPGIEKALKTYKVDSAEFARAAVSTLFCTDEEVWFTNEYRPVDSGRAELLKLLRLLGVDGSKAWDKPKAETKAAPAKKKAALSAAARKRIAAAQKTAMAKRRQR